MSHSTLNEPRSILNCISPILAQSEELGSGLVGIMALLLAGSLLGWILLGVANPRRIAGHWRWADGKVATSLVPALLVSIGVWIGIPTAYALTRPVEQSTSPVPTPSSELPSRSSHTPSASGAESPALGPAEVSLAALSSLAGLIAGLVVLAITWPESFAFLGISPRWINRGIGAGILGFLLIVIPLLWSNILTEWLWRKLNIEHPSSHDMLTLLGGNDSIALSVLIIVTAVVIAPLAEEFIFRGVLQTALAALFFRAAGYHPVPRAAPTMHKAAPDRWAQKLESTPTSIANVQDRTEPGQPARAIDSGESDLAGPLPTDADNRDAQTDADQGDALTDANNDAQPVTDGVEPPIDTDMAEAYNIDDTQIDLANLTNAPSATTTSSIPRLVYFASDPAAPVWPRWAAVLLASLLFAGVHAYWMFPPIFLLALALGYLYERTGSLWACIAVHALFNGSQTALFLMTR